MRSRRHTARLATAAFLIGLLTPGVPAGPAAAAAPPAGGMTGAQLTQLFADYGDTSGRWSGADSTASVLLPDGRVAWLFSDTMIGAVNADHTRPRSSPMINNSLVVQDGAALTATVHGGSASAPQSLIPSAVTGEWYWVADATVEGSMMKVLVNRYRKTGDGGLDFALTGTALATLALPGLTVSAVTELPLGDTVAWGAALLEDGAHTYVYGSEYVAADAMRFARLARVPAGGLGGAWEFWTGSGWSTSASASARLPLSGVGTAFGVQKVGSQYVVVTMESNTPFAAHAVAYTASSPSGPFAGPIELFTAPEPAAREGVIVYDARVHPHLAPSGRLLVSYNVHSLVSDDLYADARIYRPRFVDVAWPVPAPDPAAVPAAPANLTAAAEPTGTVNLSWPSVAGTGVSYTVYQRDVTAGQTHFGRVATASGTTQALGGFRTGHTYEFRVTARNGAGEGQPSVTRSVAVTIAAPPAPTGLTATAGSDGTIALNWNSVPYAWRYDVSRRDLTAGETAFTPVNDAAPGDTSLTVNWLAHGHEYEFAVTASHGGGTSPQSATARATAAYALPPTPAGLTAAAQGDGTIRLTWSGPAQNVYYLVFQRDVTAGETTFTQLPLPLSCCELAAGYLSHGHEYEFKVRSSNQGGESADSNLVRATSNHPLPTPPGTLSAVAGNGQVQLAWGGRHQPGHLVLGVPAGRDGGGDGVHAAADPDQHLLHDDRGLPRQRARVRVQGHLDQPGRGVGGVQHGVGDAAAAAAGAGHRPDRDRAEHGRAAPELDRAGHRPVLLGLHARRHGGGDGVHEAVAAGPDVLHVHGRIPDARARVRVQGRRQQPDRRRPGVGGGARHVQLRQAARSGEPDRAGRR
ncbi:hypothetical protein CS0771_30740 [Catellatospora sp. IY07-71]|uniref:fibronectin type III domain-containing protein n=1 Tax=Catellatospora sp. IY07-71 TaxID=2728827 RepID=UPI001BB41CBE|nr:fibronectin type III domain-containing protein [Catellatospora sp. IY07-71]BCJ73530.1 hypothetical protein CS0771_30740 [Catellatospora sp. IY07-71]